MRKIIITFLILFGLSNFLFTQFTLAQQAIFFSKSYQQNVVIENVWPCIDKGYIAGGYHARWDLTTGDWNYDNYILKTDSLGNIVWENFYDFSILDGVGIDCNIVRELNNGGYIYISCINCGQNPPNPKSKYLLIRMNNSGDTLWTKTYERPLRSAGQWVEQTNDGGFVMTGYGADNGSSADVYIVKTDSLGNEKWHKAYQLYGEDQATCIHQTSDGGYIVAAGSATSFPKADTWLLKLNSLGDTLWTKIFHWGTWNVKAFIDTTPDNGYIVAVRDSNFYQIVFKTDSLGNLLWINNFGNGNSCVAQTNDSGFAVFGSNYFSKTNQNGIITQTISNNINPIFWRQTSDGGYITSVNNNLIKTDCQGNFLFWNYTNCPIYNNPTSITDLISTSVKKKVAVFPNPSNGVFTIQSNCYIEIYNILGEKVYFTNSKQHSENKIDISNSPIGIYFIKIYNERNIDIEKIIVQ